MLSIRRIDSRREDIRAAMAELRKRLSPEGNVVSEAGGGGRSRFLANRSSPSRSSERICRDVKTLGLPALLDYSARIDRAH